MPLLEINKQKEKCYEESKIKKTIEIKTIRRKTCWDEGILQIRWLDKNKIKGLLNPIE